MKLFIKLTKREANTKKNPWLTIGLLKSIGGRNSRHKKLYPNYFQEYQSNAKMPGEGIRKVLNVSNNVKFNDFFVNIGNKVVAKIPKSKSSF